MQAADAVPPDLDLVLRIDLSRVRQALGPEFVAQLSRATELASRRDGEQAALGDVLERAELVLLGVRPRAGSALDHVMVLEGSFHGFDPAKLPVDPPWSRARDLGGDLRRWDRVRVPSRGAPALIYQFGERTIVVASVAEIDSSERSVENGERQAGLRPPSKGVFSFAARVLPLAIALEPRSPRVAEWLRAAERLEGSAELESDGLRLEFALKLDSPETAAELAPMLKALLELVSLTSSLADLVAAAKFEVAGNYVVCRLKVPRESLERWAACAGSSERCTW